MFGRYISKSLTTLLQQSVKCSPSTTRVASLLQPSRLEMVSTEQRGNKFYTSTTPLIPCCHSTLMSLRCFSTESSIESGNDAPSDLAGGELDKIAVNSSTSKQYVEEERERNMKEQESRMNRIAINGICETIDEKNLKEEVVNILRAIGVNKLDQTVIKHLSRTPKGTVVCELSERKWCANVFSCKKNIMSTDYSAVSIKHSLYPAFAAIDYNLRTLKREGKIRKNRIYSGRPQAQLLESEEWVEITHLQDLVELGLIHEV